MYRALIGNRCPNYVIGFILDESGSVAPSDWLKLVKFTKEMAKMAKLAKAGKCSNILEFYKWKSSICAHCSENPITNKGLFQA